MGKTREALPVSMKFNGQSWRAGWAVGKNSLEETRSGYGRNYPT